MRFSAFWAANYAFGIYPVANTQPHLKRLGRDLKPVLPEATPEGVQGREPLPSRLSASENMACFAPDLRQQVESAHLAIPASWRQAAGLANSYALALPQTPTQPQAHPFSNRARGGHRARPQHKAVDGPFGVRSMTHRSPAAARRPGTTYKVAPRRLAHQ